MNLKELLEEALLNYEYTLMFTEDLDFSKEKSYEDLKKHNMEKGLCEYLLKEYGFPEAYSKDLFLKYKVPYLDFTPLQYYFKNLHPMEGLKKRISTLKEILQNEEYSNLPSASLQWYCLRTSPLRRSIKDGEDPISISDQSS